MTTIIVLMGFVVGVFIGSKKPIVIDMDKIKNFFKINIDL